MRKGLRSGNGKGEFRGSVGGKRLKN